MPHFTYSIEIDTNNLHQGDLIKRTERIDAIIKEFLPHFYDDLNVCFSLVTQSCDLVRREKEDCKAKKLTFAVVRALDHTIEAEAEKYKITKMQQRFDVFDDNSQKKIEQFVERLLNNNESKYFFYAKDIDFDLAMDHCAQLEYIFTLDSKEYYDVILEAKFVQLNESFEHKLGYLIGNNYLKIGTEDWVPNTLDKSSFDKKRNYLSGKNRYFVEGRILKTIESRLSDQDLDHITVEEFDKILREEKKIAKKKKEVFNDIKEILMDKIKDNDTVETIMKLLENNPKITSKLK